MLNIYEKVIEQGIEFDNHCSDLYIPVNDETRKLVDQYDYKGSITVFNSNIDGARWFDIPFAFDPWWDKASNTVSEWAKGVSL